MEARLATAEEIPDLLQRIKDSGGVFVDLNRTPCWVAVEDGRIVGLLAAELHWQLEPLIIFAEVRNKSTRRRATYGLYRAVESWMEGPQNVTGVYKAFAVTRFFKVRKWAEAMGWHWQYKRSALFIKHFSPRK